MTLREIVERDGINWGSRSAAIHANTCACKVPDPKREVRGSLFILVCQTCGELTTGTEKKPLPAFVQKKIEEKAALRLLEGGQS